MPSGRRDFDVLVAGAGTSGSACALFLARNGFRVALVENRSLEKAGARWVNGVPDWMIESAGIALPVPPESRGRARAFILADFEGNNRLRIAPSPVRQIYVPLLVKRLHDLCRDHDVKLFGHFFAGKLRLMAGRPIELEGRVRQTSRAARSINLRARLFVDASGLAGALRRQVPLLAKSCPPPPPNHLCSAAQQVCRVADTNGAQVFLEQNRLEPGEVLARLGVAGGFSTASIYLAEDLSEVELLTGSIGDGRHPDGPHMMAELKRKQRWIGNIIYGGAGLIPLRRPYDRLVAPGFALVGDSACQVFPAHGSGTGSGLLAARALADAVGGQKDPGALDALWHYQAAWQRGFGATCASYDVFRRFSQALNGPRISQLLSSGLVTTAFWRAGLEQVLPRISFQDMSTAFKGLAKNPSLAILLPCLAAMGATRSLYGVYPRSFDPRLLAGWERVASWLFRRTPEKT